MKNFEIKNQNGRSMIEMLGVLAIIGVLSVGGIAGYSKAMTKYRINKAIEQITLIAGNVKTFFAPQKSYTGLTKAVIKKAKLVPDEMLELNADGTIKQINNAFGGTVSMESIKNNFVINFDNISTEECIELVTQDWSSSSVFTVGVFNGFEGGLNFLASTNRIDLNYQCSKGEVNTEYGYIICDTTIQIDTATTYCGASNANSVSFAFH